MGYELGELPEEARFVVASDVLDVPEAQSADFGSFGVVAGPTGAGQVRAAGEARQQSDAVALEVAAVGPGGNVESQERHGPDVAADGAFDAGFLAGTLTGRAVAVKPGREQVAGQVVAADESRAHVPAEYGGPVVAAAGVAAGQLPAVLLQPSQQRRLAGCRQSVGSDSHHPVAAVRAFLAVFEEEVEEEVEALRRAAGISGAITQVPWPAHRGGQLIQDAVELVDV